MKHSNNVVAKLVTDRKERTQNKLLWLPLNGDWKFFIKSPEDACIKKLIWGPGKTRDYSYKKQKGKLNKKRLLVFQIPAYLLHIPRN